MKARKQQHPSNLTADQFAYQSCLNEKKLPFHRNQEHHEQHQLTSAPIKHNKKIKYNIKSINNTFISNVTKLREQTTR